VRSVQLLRMYLPQCHSALRRLTSSLVARRAPPRRAPPLRAPAVARLLSHFRRDIKFSTMTHPDDVERIGERARTRAALRR
jgi:hypothetical protein